MMKHLHSLKKLIGEGLRRIEKDQNHHLNLGYREAILWALGPMRISGRGNSGYRRRVRLSLLVLDRVSPLWRKAWPEDEMMDNIYDRIRELLILPQDRIDHPSLSQEIDRMWEYTTEKTNETRNIAGVAGMAGVMALTGAVWDGFSDWESEADIDLEKKDDEDFMCNDAHFYASVAFCGGPPYPIALATDSDPEKRLEFWRWWLKEAVPQSLTGAMKIGK